MYIEIRRHEILIEGERIAIGDKIEQADKILGQSERYEQTYYYNGADIAIFVKEDLIEVIEIRRDAECACHVVVDETDVFYTEKSEVLQILTLKNQENSIDEDECVKCFKNLCIHVGMGISEEDVNELIRETKEDGMYEEMKEEIRKDVERAKYIETIRIF